MKPKANLNLPQWSIVIWIIMALAMGVEIFTMKKPELEFINYLSLSQTVIEILLWAAILFQLHKQGNLAPVLIICIVLCLLVSLIIDIATIFKNDTEGLEYLHIIMYILTPIVIIFSYSGALRVYAISELACTIAIIALFILSYMYDFDLSNRGILKYVIIPLIVIPYLMLDTAIKEGAAEEDED